MKRRSDLLNSGQMWMTSGQIMASGMVPKWQVQEAKARLSELIARAESDGPQFITRHGTERAVVLSIEDYRVLVGAPLASGHRHPPRRDRPRPRSDPGDAECPGCRGNGRRGHQPLAPCLTGVAPISHISQRFRGGCRRLTPLGSGAKSTPSPRNPERWPPTTSLYHPTSASIAGS